MASRICSNCFAGVIVLKLRGQIYVFNQDQETDADQYRRSWEYFTERELEEVELNEVLE